MTTDQILEAKKAERKAAGLYVRVTTPQGPFDYYPATKAKKAEFIRLSLADGRTILEGA